MKGYKRILAAALALLCILAMAAGCKKKSSALQDVTQRETLRVLMSPEFPPYGYYDAEGSLMGTDSMLAQKLADLLGVTLEVVPVNFADLAEALAKGEGDVIISAYPVSRAQAEGLQASDVYLKNALYVIVKAENEELTDAAQLEGKIIGVQRASQADYYATDRVSAKNVERYGYVSEAMDALLAGKLEAVIADGTTASYFQSLYETEIKRIYVGESAAEYCVALPEGSDLLTEVNSLISTMNATGELEGAVLQHTLQPEATEGAEGEEPPAE